MPLSDAAIEQWVNKLNRAAANNWAGAQYHRDDFWTIDFAGGFPGDLVGDIAPRLNGSLVHESRFGSNLTGFEYDATGTVIWHVKTQRGDQVWDGYNDPSGRAGDGYLHYNDDLGSSYGTYYGQDHVVRLNEAFDERTYPYSSTNYGGLDSWVPEVTGGDLESPNPLVQATNEATVRALGWTFANNYTELLKIGRYPLSPQYHSCGTYFGGRGFARGERTLYQGAAGLYAFEWRYDSGSYNGTGYWDYPTPRNAPAYTTASFGVGFTSDRYDPLKWRFWDYEMPYDSANLSVYGYRGPAPTNQYQGGGLISGATLLGDRSGWSWDDLGDLTSDMVSANDSGVHVNLPCDGDPYVKPNQIFKYPGPVRVAGSNGTFASNEVWGGFSAHLYDYSREMRWDTVEVSNGGWKIGTVQM